VTREKPNEGLALEKDEYLHPKTIASNRGKHTRRREKLRKKGREE